MEETLLALLPILETAKRVFPIIWGIIFCLWVLSVSLRLR